MGWNPLEQRAFPRDAKALLERPRIVRIDTMRANMPRGSKAKYTDKQKRKAEHIEDGYEDRGVSHREAERRSWATVNKESGGGNKSGSGRGERDTKVSARKGGLLGGRAAAKRSPAANSASARKAARTRKARRR